MFSLMWDGKAGLMLRCRGVLEGKGEHDWRREEEEAKQEEGECGR